MKYIGLVSLALAAIVAGHSLSIPGDSCQNRWYKEIPVLCYHNIKRTPVREDFLTISESHLDAQLKFLHDGGYHAVLPEQLYEHLVRGDQLPSRPFMISFDDTHGEDFSLAAPLVEKYGFRAVFFIMTVCIDKPNYLTSAQIKELSDRGHCIATHTWDHLKITGFGSEDWKRQIERPRLQLERLTGRPVDFFAYPYGLWNETVIGELKKRNIKAAFQLAGKASDKEPLFTIRRLMVSGSWQPAELEVRIKNSFKEW